ncbi:hypothetical protein ACVSTU_23220, partial [Yersinia enterocolitica]
MTTFNHKENVYFIKQILGIQDQRKGVVIATKKRAKVECARVPSANGWKVHLKARKTKAPETLLFNRGLTLSPSTSERLALLQKGDKCYVAKTAKNRHDLCYGGTHHLDDTPL